MTDSKFVQRDSPYDSYRHARLFRKAVLIQKRNNGYPRFVRPGTRDLLLQVTARRFNILYPELIRKTKHYSFQDKCIGHCNLDVSATEIESSNADIDCKNARQRRVSILQQKRLRGFPHYLGRHVRRRLNDGNHNNNITVDNDGRHAIGCMNSSSSTKINYTGSTQILGDLEICNPISNSLLVGTNSDTVRDTIPDLSNDIFSLGDPIHECMHCGALMWYEERTHKSTKVNNPRFSICCLDGKVKLPFLREPPPFLKSLLDPDGGRKAKNYRTNIRAYNSMFSFTSMGGHIDHDINRQKGPYIFRLNGQNHHLIGSLLPSNSGTPRFAQLYVCDTANEISNRIAAVQGNVEEGKLDRSIIGDLMNMLNENNILVQVFRMARDRFNENSVDEFHLRLFNARSRDGREYDLPISSEIAALIVGGSGNSSMGRDIIIEHKYHGLQRIKESHPSYMAMQYPLLFPYGEDGFRFGILHQFANHDRVIKQRKTTIREYYAYRIQQRSTEAHTLLKSEKLFQQYIVDAYTCIEENRLQWIRGNQPKLRSHLYCGLRDAVVHGDINAQDVGRRKILPSTYTGGPRYMVQNYQDAMAICRWAGYPDLFVTFTCNPKWPEIKSFIEKIGQRIVIMRPDVIVRVFNARLYALMDDIRKKNHFGKAIAVLYTIEFQKRGLPHAHILIFLHPDDKEPTSAYIDSIISAEIPDKEVDPLGHLAVQNYMIHGPCGTGDVTAQCMKETGQCDKHYPKKYHRETTIDEDGYPIYRRRETSILVLKNGVKIDNRFVVPYNRDLIVKHQAHINVELCNKSRSIKYLFKYVTKVPDRATLLIERQSNGCETLVADEIKTYVDCRYVSATEACWRIFQFKINFREPGVERLNFHLEDEQPVIFADDDNLNDIVDDPRLGKTIFTEWMVANNKYEDARQLTYTEFPERWVWDKKKKEWHKRKRGRCIGRIYYTHPASGERYYLRMLLNYVRGPMSFEDIRTINGVVYPTYKEACYRRGLLGDDREWEECLEGASFTASGCELRQLFVTLLLFCDVTDPGKLWLTKIKILTEDVRHSLRQQFNFPDLQLSDEQVQNYALLEIETMLQRRGKRLADFDTMPRTNLSLTADMRNRLVLEEMSYDRRSLTQEFEHLHGSLNAGQREAYSNIIESVEKGTGRVFFVDGHGGTGKTYVWRALLARIRSRGQIAIAVASSGIAALLLPGGRTAHSRFRIPLEPDDESTCLIEKGSNLAELLQKTKLIIWDEAPMANKYCFESVDRSLKDIVGHQNSMGLEMLFGGITTVLGGDFRQILPVVPKGQKDEIILASLKSSYIWNHVTVLTLTENMRLFKSSSSTANQELVDFSNWVLQIGNGTTLENGDEGWVALPVGVQIDDDGDPIHTIFQATFSEFNENFMDSNYLQERAILAPTNEIVHRVNQHMLSQIKSEEVCYLSSDSISKLTSNFEEQVSLYPIEFLNTLKFSGIPNHRLVLKIGVPIILLRNIDQQAGLCNGTRLVVTQLGKWFIEARPLTGPAIGQKVFIPRVDLTSPYSKWPFVMKRRQFPVALCYAMTINKSQGQSLNHVGLYLPRQVFSHGQLYVAISRVTTKKGLKIVICDASCPDGRKVKNIVYKDILN